MRCDCNFKESFLAEKVPQSIIEFEACGKLCCKTCMQTRVRETSDRGIFLAAFACNDCMNVVGPYLDETNPEMCTCALF